MVFSVFPFSALNDYFGEGAVRGARLPRGRRAHLRRGFARRWGEGAVLRTARVIAVVVLVAGLAAMNAAPASAKKAPRKVKVYGVVVAVNRSSADGACGTSGASGSFKVLSRSTSRTVVHVHAGTRFVARKIGSPSFANVCVDTMVGATGHIRNGRFVATKVKIWSPKTRPTASVFGMVVKVNGSSADGACGTLGGKGTFKIMNRNAARKVVEVDASTVFSSRTVASPTFANVCVDEMVGATGFRSGRVITATDVMIWSTVPDDFAAFGMVISVNGSSADGACGTAGASGTFTVLRRNRSRRVVNVTSATTFTMKDVAAPSFANVCVYTMVGSHGAVTSSGLNADRVRIFARPGFRPASVFGMVVSVNGSTAAGACGTSGGTGTFTIIKRNASRANVVVTTSTRFRPKGATSFADVCVNGMVGATGVLSGTDLVANVVRIHAAPGTP
jgi:hypothetical protein